MTDRSPSAPSAAARPWSIRHRTALRLALAAAVLFALGGIVWRAVNSEAARGLLRRELASALAARIPGARIDGAVHVDPALHVIAAGVVVPGEPGAPPVVSIDRLVARPCFSALLRGRAAAASFRLEGVRIDAGPRGSALVGLVRRMRSARPESAERSNGARPAPLPDIRFAGLTLSGTLSRRPGSSIITLGPLDGRLRLSRPGERTDALAQVRFSQGGAGEARIRREGGRTSASLHLHGVAPGAIPSAIQGRLPVAMQGGTLSFDLDADRLEALDRGEARVSIGGSALVVRAGRLSEGPVGPLTGRASGRLRWDLSGAAVSFEDGRVELGEGGRTGADVRASFHGRPEARFSVDARASADWEALAKALPAALAPPPEAPALRGVLLARLSVSGPLRQRSRWTVEGDLDPSGLSPTVTAGAPGAERLDRPFTFHAPLASGGTRDVVIGPANTAFVPLNALPAYVVRAVTTSEDAGFYAHHGFDLSEVQDALARSGSHGRLRGASTISQQLAKNLFLSPERTLARKAREALATIALEAALPKRRLLEIYLNLAEWGPGVRGIGEAARHWFGKDARALTPKEACFLATVIPNPVKYERYRRRGALTDAWEERVRGLLLKLHATGAIDDEQLYLAWDAPLRFAGAPGPDEPLAPPAPP